MEVTSLIALVHGANYRQNVAWIFACKKPLFARTRGYASMRKYISSSLK
jgi:hypothetical protein